jgi:UDP-N-acetylglucosamine:LPS N-acetylglucosamine transferase
VKASEAYFPTHRRHDLVATGYPLRPQLTHWANLTNRREEGLKTFNLSPELPVLLVYGGSKGAQSINRALMAILPELLADMQVIHLSGQTGWPQVQAFFHDRIANLPGDLAGRYRVYAYLHDEMGAALSAASLALTRAGASTLGELTAFSLPAILVPYPYAWRYQMVNASFLAERGAAEIMEDSRLDTDLRPRLRALAADSFRLSQMQVALKNLSQPAAAKKLAELILDLGRPAGGVL